MTVKLEAIYDKYRNKISIDSTFFQVDRIDTIILEVGSGAGAKLIKMKVVQGE